MSKKIKILTFILIIIVLGIFIGFEINNIMKQPENILPTKVKSEQKEDKKDINKLFSEDIDLSQKRSEFNNNDIVARLEIPNVFNLLLTQTTNNKYYINYDIRKNKSNKGTEYIDYRSSLKGKQINVYGHNSDYYDLPFKKLEKFNDKNFFDQNQYLLLQTEDARRIYEIAIFKKISEDYEYMKFDEKDYLNHLEKIIEEPIYTRNLAYSKNTNIIILQTCIMNKPEEFYLLIGYEIN